MFKGFFFLLREKEKPWKKKEDSSRKNGTHANRRCLPNTSHQREFFIHRFVWENGSVPMTPQIRWSIVVPVLNEGATLGRMVERLHDLPGISNCEIWIVDGGSTDQTRDVFMECAREHPKLLFLEAPAGKGIGLRLAFSRARGKYIAFLDGDLQYAPAELPKLMRRIERGADLVVTRRKVVWADNSARRLASHAFKGLGRALFDMPASDPQSGMKAFRASLLPRLHLTAMNWGLDVQLIRQVQKNGGRIEEVEIEFRPRPGGQTKTGLISTSFDLLRTALEEKIRERKKEKVAPFSSKRRRGHV